MRGGTIQPPQHGPTSSFELFDPFWHLQLLGYYQRVFRSPVLAQKIALSTAHNQHLIARRVLNPMPGDTAVGVNNLPRRIPGPRLSNTPIIHPVYDYGAQPLG